MVERPIHLHREIFNLRSGFKPKGSQPQAIEKLIRNLKGGVSDQVLLGITGSGKTFTMANVIQSVNRPTLIIAHNKTLAAQLFTEFRELFPENAVEYFVSFYDYYQPEAYVPATDTYIEKDSAINDTIDKMRHSATRSLLERNDVIIVSSVSCIYGLGSPEAYYGMLLYVEKDQKIEREEILAKLIQIGYVRSDYDFHRGTFRVRGDVVEVFPASEESKAIRIELFGDTVDGITEVDSLTGRPIRKLVKIAVYPTSHYITWPETIDQTIGNIRAELKDQIMRLKNDGKVLEAKRLEQRTNFDLEMLKEAGFCLGIENYSRHLTGRAPGEAPYTLLDYFPSDFLLIVDESHATVPQIGGMYNGDRSRKMTLVEHGFRLPSALDNRPLKFEEFCERVGQTIYVSATPGDYEVNKSGEHLIEQIIRPTGLLDPAIEIKPAKNQVDSLIAELRAQVAKGERTLVTTLTKKSAENLSEYLQSLQFKVRYMHADIETLERSQLIKDLRLGIYDILIGINLLREGLDLPEVSLVAIMDADKEGFLRSASALIQTIGRAARHEQGRVVMYADNMTNSMKIAIDETNRRREKQSDYNKQHDITPRGVDKAIDEGLRAIIPQKDDDKKKDKLNLKKIPKDEYPALVRELTAQMELASANLEFERAAELRDTITDIKQTMK